MPDPAVPARPAFVLTLACRDRMGIVADVARFLTDHRCNILESDQFGDRDTGQFFLRTAFESLGGPALPDLVAAFQPIADTYGMDARFFDMGRKTPTVIMVSKLGHCLNDLLYRWHIGALAIDIRAVISNHPDLQSIAAVWGLPFHHLPTTPATKPAQEDKVRSILADTGAELIVLARYMQVLSEGFCADFPGQIINIHHSFLPSFKGARPYHRAHDRGVKLIGATAHYVTPDLDEGPIIEQAVERVEHSHAVADYVAVGRDIEAIVLARAVQWHAEHRILVNGNRTVVFY